MTFFEQKKRIGEERKMNEPKTSDEVITIKKIVCKYFSAEKKKKKKPECLSVSLADFFYEK